jgi:CheY-like chemotaxis protein
METDATSPCTILFGFGDPVTRDDYFSMFRNGNYQLLTASSGEEVLSLFRDHPGVALVILTVELGGSNGFEIMNQMKNERPGIPVFLLSTGVSFESLKLACLYNGDEVLQLPLQKSALMALVNKYLSHH